MATQEAEASRRQGSFPRSPLSFQVTWVEPPALHHGAHTARTGHRGATVSPTGAGGDASRRAQEGHWGPRVQGTEDQLRSCPSSQSPGGCERASRRGVVGSLHTGETRRRRWEKMGAWTWGRGPEMKMVKEMGETSWARGRGGQFSKDRSGCVVWLCLAVPGAGRVGEGGEVRAGHCV